MNEFYMMTEEREKALWEDALIVFDTNAICSLYNMTEETQNKMLGIIDFLKDRVWIPGHVLYEYKKNRMNAIRQSMSTWYANPAFINDKYLYHLKEFVRKIEEQAYYHPYFDNKELESFKNKVEEVSNLMNSISEVVKEQFKKRKQEILASQESDNILIEVLALHSGKEFSFQEKIEIMKEGEWRYSQELPPGYMDYSSKHGIQKYGDLIIWKEILNKAKDEKRSIIFITNDIKEDWYEQGKREPISPRHELILEFFDTTQKDIWLYTVNQFIEQLKKRFKDNTTIPFYDDLEAVIEELALMKKRKENVDKRKKANYVRVVCDDCNHQFNLDINDFYFDWELASVNERNMGPEREYECTEGFECPICGNECRVNFRVWEYPAGAYNYSEIDTDGCELKEDEIDLSKHISFEDGESCVVCGTWAILDENDYCPECAERINRMMEDDD